jgi:DNA-binding MarR family transcriptional regulator
MCIECLLDSGHEDVTYPKYVIDPGAPLRNGAFDTCEWIGRIPAARDDASVDTTRTRTEAVEALQSVLSTLAYGLTRRRLHERLVAAAGMPIDRPGLALLRVLADEARPLRVGELANRLDVRHPHVTRQVRQLQEQGLVERVDAQGDRRGQLIAPTRQGLDTLKRVVQSVEARLSESLAAVEPEKIRAAAEVLTLVMVGIGPGWGAPPEEEAAEAD